MHETDSSEEILDRVDDNDTVIGTVVRHEIYKKGGLAENGFCNFRVVNVFIKNSHGKLWIPRRTAEKKLFPLRLDISVGGHVTSGEDYLTSAIRETEEETGLQLQKESFRLLGKLTPHTDHMSAFMEVYEVITDDVPDYNKNDFCGYYWFTPQELIEKIENGDKAKGDLPKLIKKFYLPT